MIKRYLILIIILFIMPIIGKSQSKNGKIKKPQSIEKRKKELAKKKEEQDLELIQAKEEFNKRHLSIQSKKTRKQMKKAKKKSKRVNDHKRKRRWFWQKKH